MSELNAADGIAILQADNTSPIEQQPAAAAIPEKGDLSTSLFVQHLASYPAVAALAGLTASVPVVKIFVSNAVPLMVYLNDRSKPVTEPVVKRATPIITKVDKFGDDVLTNVDKKFPQLKTTQPKDVYSIATKPVDQAKSTVAAYTDAAKGTVNHRVLDPIKAATHKARSQYAKVYDTQGKALIRSRIDPLVLPLNNRLELAIEEFLPESGEGTKLPASEELSNEISRSWRLARTAYRRAGPAVLVQVSYVRELPSSTTAHIQHIYEEKQALHSKGEKPTLYSTALAGLGTCYQLTEEGRQAVSTSLQHQKEYLLAPVKTLYKNVEVAEEGAKTKVYQATDYLKSFVPGAKPTVSETVVDAVSEAPAVVTNGN